MISVNTSSGLNVKAPAKWGSNLSLGLEIWQILIVLTIILTSASGLMWFTNLQPENLKQEYLLIDKTKSEIFNKAEKIKFEIAEVVFPESAKVSTKICYEDVNTNNFNSKSYVDKVFADEQDLNEINNNLLGRINILSNSGVNDVIKQSLDYSVESKLNLQNADIYFQQVQKINKESIELCKSTLDKLPQLVSSLEMNAKNTAVLDINSNLNTSILNMLQKSDIIADSVAKTGDVKPEDKMAFLKDFTEVITSKVTKDRLLASSSKKYEDLILKIDALEKWQKSFLVDKNTNIYKTVWVLSKNKI